MFFEVIRYRGRRRIGVDAYTRSGVFHNQASPRAGNDRAGIAPPRYGALATYRLGQKSRIVAEFDDRDKAVAFVERAKERYDEVILVEVGQ